MSQQLVTVDMTTSSVTTIEQPLYISLSPAIDRRSMDRASSKSPSRRSRSFSTGQRPRHRPSWASFWSAEGHRLSAFKSGTNNELPSCVYQDSLPNAQTSHPGRKVNRRNQSNSIGDSTVNQKSTKGITSKFERIFQLFGIQSCTKKQPIRAVPTSRVWETVYDGTDDEKAIKEQVFSPFALDLTLEISMDKSELEYLRRTQAEEFLEFQKRILFAQVVKHYLT